MIRTIYKKLRLEDTPRSPYKQLLHVQGLLNCGEFEQLEQALAELCDIADVTDSREFLESYRDFRLDLIDDEQGEKTPEVRALIRENLMIEPGEQKMLANIRHLIDYIQLESKAVGINMENGRI